MAKLSDIAKVVIDLRTAAIGKASFGIPMIAAKLGAAFDKRVYTFEDAPSAEDIVGTDGTTHLPADVIKAVQVAFSQTPRIERVIVGNLFETYAEQIQIDRSLFDSSTGNAPANTVWSFSVDGTIFQHDTGATTDTKLDAVMTDFETKLNADQSVKARYSITVDKSAGTITLQVLSIGIVPVVTAKTNTTVTETRTLIAGIPSQIGDIQGTDNSWYGFTVLGIDDTEQDAIALYAESAEPAIQFWTTSETPAIWQQPSGDILDQLRNKQYNRTLFVPNKNDGEFPQVAAMVKFFVYEPGKVIAGLKTLTGVTFSAFTPDEAKTILGKNGNTYERYAANVFIFNPGKMVSGAWADEIRDRDWLQNYIQTSMVSALLRSPKIPYTNPGITTLVNVLQGCLRYAQQQGVIAPDQLDSMGNTVPGFVVDAPNALDVPFDIKASRVLTLKFTALLAGAIQQVKIDGILTYSYDGA